MNDFSIQRAETQAGAAAILRHTWAEISPDAIAANAALFKSKLRPGCKLMAVVKANGYGHGDREAAHAALGAGADWLGVAVVDEALRLRAAGIAAPMLALGYTPPEAIEPAIRRDIALTVSSAASAAAVLDIASRIRQPARVHLKIDTGMSRLGVQGAGEALQLARQLTASRYVRLEGAFTHFASADEPDCAATLRQFAAFLNVADMLKEHGCAAEMLHGCNSAGTMRFPEMHLDMVRVGIALYGLQPSAATATADYRLQPAMQLKARIAEIRRVPPQTAISYGGTFVTSQETTLATLPIGYADGLPRLLSNTGQALVHGRRVPIVGRICMDQTMIDVTALPGVRVGDEAVLLGAAEAERGREAFEHGGEGADDAGEARSEDAPRITAEEVAERAGTIHYEIVCAIGSRVPRRYV